MKLIFYGFLAFSLLLSTTPIKPADGCEVEAFGLTIMITGGLMMSGLTLYEIIMQIRNQRPHPSFSSRLTGMEEGPFWYKLKLPNRGDEIRLIKRRNFALHILLGGLCLGACGGMVAALGSNCSSMNSG